MKFTLEIELGNDGVEDYYDLGSKLAILADDLKELYGAERKFHVKDGNVIQDACFNTVGAWAIVDPRHTITPAKGEPFEVNDAQYKALQRKFKQNPDGANDFKEFASRAQYTRDCIMLPWCGMWLGIELDGYTHS